MALPALAVKSAEPPSKEQQKSVKQMQLLDNQKRLIPGDAAGIKIVEDKRAALNLRVSRTGGINFPYVGLMKVTGLTCRDVAFRCKAALEKNFFRTATVLVVMDKVHPAYEDRTHCGWPDFAVAYGAVSKPGKYELPEGKDVTVTSLLKLAGGCTTKSQMPKIQIVRCTPKGNKRILVNAKAILSGLNSEYDLFLRSNDVVIVE